LIVVDTFIK